MFKEHPDLSTKRRRGPMRGREKVTLKPFREFLCRDTTGTLLGGSGQNSRKQPNSLHQPWGSGESSDTVRGTGDPYFVGEAGQV